MTSVAWICGNFSSLSLNASVSTENRRPVASSRPPCTVTSERSR